MRKHVWLWLPLLLTAVASPAQAGVSEAEAARLESDLTPMGAERLSGLRPSTDPQQVAQWQASTTETVRFVTAHGLFPLRASSDLPQILVALAVEGRALESLRLLALATFLDSIDEARAGIRRAPILPRQ